MFRCQLDDFDDSSNDPDLRIIIKKNYVFEELFKMFCRINTGNYSFVSCYEIF